MSNRELSANARDAWRDCFHRFVGRGKHVRFDDLAEQSGVPVGTLRSISAGDHCPSWGYALQILECLPLAAQNIVFAPLRVTVSPVQGAGCNRATNSATAKVASKMADALMDGRVDHQERAQIRPYVEDCVEACQRWLNEVPTNIATLPIEGKVS